MRSTIRAMLAALALLAVAAPAPAQETGEGEGAPPPAAATAGLPDAPVPYVKIRPPRPRPKANRTPTPAATTAAVAAPAAAPGPAGAPPLAAGVPAPVAGARFTPGQAIPPAELEAFVDGLMTDAMAREHIAGASVSIVQNGQVVLKKGYGFADLSPRRAVDPDRTLFRIASISKTFTWITVMKQVEAGRMRLDRPVNDYLPPKARIKDQGYDAPVRLVHLMDHTGGFEDRALGQLFESRFDRVRPLDLYLRQEKPRRVRPPGQVPSYSNYGVAVAGLAAATAARRPFESLVETELLRPLGMGRTTFREPHPPKQGIPAPMPAALARDISEGYRWTPAGFEQRPLEYVSHVAPAGSAWTTAGDMTRYMIMLLNDGRYGEAAVYGPRTAAALRTPLRRTPPGVNGWAHGFIVYELPGGFRGYGHDGATMSFLSRMVTVPSLGLGIFVTTNTETGAALAQRLPEAVVREFYAAAAPFPRPGSRDLLDRADVFAGHYQSTRRAYGGLEGFVTGVAGGAKVSVTPQGRLMVSGREGVRTYVPEGDVDRGRFVGAEGEQRLAFGMRDGEAISFQTAAGAALMVRAPFWRTPEMLLGLVVLATGAAVATLVGLFARSRRETRENAAQARAGLVQNIQALLWLAAFALFAIWALRDAADLANLMFGWPGPLLVLASSSAFVATAMTLVTLAALPAIWQGGRRVDSWSVGRKAAFTLTTLIYAALALVLGLSGALAPWSG